MSTLTERAVTEALQAVPDPDTGKDFVTTRCLRNLTVDGGAVRFKVEPGYPVASRGEAIRDLLARAVCALPGVEHVEIDVGAKIVAHAVKNGVKLLPGIKNIIAVASGKGGVGKSTTAANLALALVAEGARVGVLDADIYGPSQPQMLGIAAQHPSSLDGKTMEPIEAHGLQVMSIGLLIDEDTPMVWRGPLATRALTQLVTETHWDGLDYLVIDLPPGTGDIQLTLAQSVPVTGAIIVTTPQDIALIDARKGLKMFEKVNVPILGVVENMSIHICSNCGHEEHIFGADGGQKICADYDVPFLGALPLDLKIREEADAGAPTVVADPSSRIAGIYLEIARKVAIAIAGTPRDMSHKFPNIVVRNG
ncbi:MAG: iron-sulfur cluster carrier protein ApbC [Azoarcus sp.]|jgi:ATP-binding protein involved in chromosome partitioning|nr:iron-sulfur cluster carrier protein ApbC [Azoarcus sp.]